jgi:hypothetical protein
VGVAISGLVAATNIQEADVLEIEQDGISKKITKTQLRSLLLSDPDFATVLPQAGDSLTYNGTDWATGARGGWRTVPQAAYTFASPTSTSTITFDGSTTTDGINLKAGDYFSVGSPVRVEIGASTYFYGICTAVSDTLLTMSGMILPLSAITSLAVGTKEMVKHVDLRYAGTEASDVYTGFGATTAIPRGMSHQWRGATGYLVAASAAHTNTSSTTVINFKMNAGSNVLTSGLTPAAGGSATAQGAFVDSALGDIIAANAAIADKQTITTVCTTAGTTAESLVACLTFIVP